LALASPTYFMMPESLPAVMKMGLRSRVSMIPFMNMFLFDHLKFVDPPVMVIMTCPAEIYAFAYTYTYGYTYACTYTYIFSRVHLRQAPMSSLYITLKLISINELCQCARKAYVNVRRCEHTFRRSKRWCCVPACERVREHTSRRSGRRCVRARVCSSVCMYVCACASVHQVVPASISPA